MVKMKEDVRIGCRLHLSLADGFETTSLVNWVLDLNS